MGGRGEPDSVIWPPVIICAQAWRRRGVFTGFGWLVFLRFCQRVFEPESLRTGACRFSLFLEDNGGAAVQPTPPPPTRLGDCEGSGGLISACRILTVWPCWGGRHHCPLNVAFLLKQIPRSKQQYERKADIVSVFFIYLFFPLCYYDTAHPGGVVQGCVVCSREYLIFVCVRERCTRWLGFYLSCRCLELL